ncbi:MAG TPA: MupA/Atu3671 family FMN-dependent luciferase-like monooxygenase [Candidatus Angelobacter sp.]|nr:MupA/Atu3671 family FMN-dependent luciferase-like monooxygenase [Candidatus Angelobacter sp.]
MNTALPATLLELLRRKTEEDPARALYAFAAEPGNAGLEITREQLDRRARVIAAWLHSRTNPGDRVVLAYPFGPDFIAGFFGGIYAGRIPVPAYPPRAGRKNQAFTGICNDARPSAGLTTRLQFSRIGPPGSLSETIPESHWCCTEELPDSLANEWTEPRLSSQDIAFLQYTSGSTSAPKGVIVSHGNIIQNQQMIQRAFETDQSSVVVSWLPLFHDMGLIGAVLQPLWAGGRCVLLSPQTFLRNPGQWLQTITRVRATISGGPDFGYRLCVEKIGEEEIRHLDLSRWKVAFNGSEPVRADTIRSFAQKFSRCGFDRRAFHPCYGLAEATLLVSAKPPASEPLIKPVSPEKLAWDRAVTDDGSGRKRDLVACGVPSIEEGIAIVVPGSNTPLGHGEVGEIWVSGLHVARGYWNQTATGVFGSKIAGQDASYLRTGDLGFMAENQLFITGRHKDLIVVRGRNFYPQDFEMLVAQSDASFASGLSAAFTVSEGTEETLVIVQESLHRNLDFSEISRKLRETILAEHQLAVGKFVFVRSGVLPRTTSGKIRRQECKTMFLENRLKTIFEEAARPASPSNEKNGLPEDTSPLNAPLTGSRVEAYLKRIAGQVLPVPEDSIDQHASLFSLGLDSLAGAGLVAGIARDLQREIPLNRVLEGVSLAELAAIILEAPPPEAAAGKEAPQLTSGYPLSSAQSAIWYLSRLSPDNAAYNISVAAETGPEFDERIFQESLYRIVKRHDAMRTVIRTGTEGPYQQVLEEPAVLFQIENAEGTTEDELQRKLLEESCRTFDLEKAPLFRVALFQAAGRSILLFVFHHIIVDFWSLEVVLEELGLEYEALSRGATPAMPPPGNYREYVQWQSAMVQSPRGLKSRAYWHEQLQGDLPLTELPLVRPRPAVQGYNGASFHFGLDPVVTASIAAQSRLLGVSLYSMLFAAFHLLLGRYTGQSEVIAGSPASGRLSPRWDRMVGLLMNQIVVRTSQSAEMEAGRFVQELQTKLAGALAHQEYPFALLVEELQPERNASHSPVFQLMFSFQHAQKREHRGLERFLLGLPGGELQLGPLKLKSMAFENRTAQLDMTLVAAQVDGVLCGTFQYNSDLFDQPFVRQLAEHYKRVLSSIAGAPNMCLCDVPLLTPAEQQKVLTRCDEIDPQNDPCVHQLVEEQAAARPSAIAVSAAGSALTYSDLSRQVNALAEYLRSRGAGLDVPVVIYASRSAALLVGILGTLKAGAAFVPIDPSVPASRAAAMFQQTGARLVLTEAKLDRNIFPEPVEIIYLDRPLPDRGQDASSSPMRLSGNNLAYVLFTSGSTGMPKGVMITHRNLSSFFQALDHMVACNAGDQFFAATSISFDISILELLWPLTRGASIVLLPEQFKLEGVRAGRSKAEAPIDFSLFYFASVDQTDQGNKYELMLEGARHADKNGYLAVWTPERHFHEFGGIFPNPSTTGAAIAAITRRVAIRAGSVVLPLHNPIRVAEEWSVVDNLSGGRVGVAFASGWHADDFALSPQNYQARKEGLFRGIETLQRLWSGGAIRATSGSGKEVELRIYPRPLQEHLPIWITAAGSPETFRRAGEIGANVLTHLLGQSVEALAVNIRGYRKARLGSGHDPEAGKVTLMLHTFLGRNTDAVREQVRAPFKNYLRSSVDLINTLVRSEGLNVDLEGMKPQDMDDLLSFAFDRYFETSALFGTVQSCRFLVERLKELGVNEIACLIDFGIASASVLASLHEVDKLMELSRPVEFIPRATAEDAVQVRFFQCTPSMMKILLADPANLELLRTLNVLLLGGESLPAELAAEVRLNMPECRVFNMYGPTETTIWSSAYSLEADAEKGSVPIGRPLANTSIYILDIHGGLAPAGVRGEICIGGSAVARGYLNSASATAEKFVADPFSPVAGARLYRTGDIGHYRPDGSIEFAGRRDAQIKIRGFRVELGEIEAALSQHQEISQCAVLADLAGHPTAIIAYVVPRSSSEMKADSVKAFLRQTLPEYMVPSRIVFLESLPLTSSGKIDRKKLPDLGTKRPELETDVVLPRNETEQAIGEIWKRLLKISDPGIDDNFFDLGGHSLLMVQVQREIMQRFKQDISLIKLLEHPTIRLLATYLHGTATNHDTSAASDRAARHKQAMLQRKNTPKARIVV